MLRGDGGLDYRGPVQASPAGLYPQLFSVSKEESAGELKHVDDPLRWEADKMAS